MFWWTLQNFVVAGFLAAFVEVGCRAVRIGPVGRHVLWLLVLLKLVAPPVILQWPWEVPAPLQLTSRLPDVTTMPGPVVTPEAAVDAGGPAVSDPLRIPGSPATSTTASAAEVRPEGSRKSGAFRSSFAAALQGALPYIRGVWLIGGIVFLLIQCLRMALIVRSVRIARPSGPPLSEQVDTLARHLRIRSVRTRVVPGITSPLIWCGNPLHPQLLWPARLPTGSSVACLRGLIVHELAHVKRRDHWVGWIELVAGCLWWWNPLFWFVRSRVRENAELSCDAWVVSELPDSRRAYADALLAVCAGTPAGLAAFPALGVGTDSRQFLERRLAMIMRERVPLRLSRAGMFGFAVLALTTLPVWAMNVGPGFNSVDPIERPSLSAGDPLAGSSFRSGPPTLGPTVLPTAHPAVRPSFSSGDHPLHQPIGTRIEKQIDLAPQSQSQQPVVVAPETPVYARSTVPLTLDDVLRASLARNQSVSTVHNAYWDLVYATEAVESTRQSLALATKLTEDNTAKVEAGILAKIDITSAQAAAAQRNQAVVQAENNRRVLELSLKRLILTGTGDPNWLATIDPIDRPEFRPASTDLATAIDRVRRIDPMVMNDITGAAITLAKAAESIQTAQATRELSQQRLEAELKQFDAGLSTNSAVVQAQRELSETRLSELRAVLNYRKAQVEFDRLQETAWNVNLPVR